MSIGEDDDFETNVKDSINLKMNSIKALKTPTAASSPRDSAFVVSKKTPRETTRETPKENSLAVSTSTLDELQDMLESFSADSKPKVNAKAKADAPAAKSELDDLQDLIGMDDDGDSFDFPTLSINRNKAEEFNFPELSLKPASESPSSSQSASKQPEDKGPDFRLKRKSNYHHCSISINISNHKLYFISIIVP